MVEDEAIVVNYGLPNDGASAIAERLKHIHLPVPLGINLVVTNRGPGAAPLKAYQIIGEYADGAKSMAPFADYLMLNLSCPNTADGHDFFADAGHLKARLDILAAAKLELPVFLKVSPLGGIAAIERVLAAADAHDFVSGFTFNLPPTRPDGLRTAAETLRTMRGAVSGCRGTLWPISASARRFAGMDRKRHVLVGAGGVFTAQDAAYGILVSAPRWCNC